MSLSPAAVSGGFEVSVVPVLGDGWLLPAGPFAWDSPVLECPHKAGQGIQMCSSESSSQ